MYITSLFLLYVYVIYIEIMIIINLNIELLSCLLEFIDKSRLDIDKASIKF